MTSPLSHPTPMTLEEYFAFDETVEARHEYVDGFVYAMTGGTSRHGVIASNVTGYLWSVLRRGACRLFTGNRKLRVLRNVFVPDVMVACGDVSTETDAEVAATYVVEVTSPSRCRSSTSVSSSRRPGRACGYAKRAPNGSWMRTPEWPPPGMRAAGHATRQHRHAAVFPRACDDGMSHSPRARAT
ncbi:MAG: Uma2 family endonuclease [Gemmatimonadota bacterium]